jgi:FkbM family methyltransferase
VVRAEVAPAANVYDELVAPGALVFDIGANVGARTREFLERGAFVVAVEPQPACMAELERQFGDDPRVLLVENALGAEEGVGTMLCTSASTIASMSPDWIEHVRASGRFSEYTWGESIEVPVSTMSALIAEVGAPAFCKIDVEGFESQVLAGLDHPVRAVSFEFVPEHLEGALASIERLDTLGAYEYNLSLGESLGFETATWRSAEEMRARLTTLAHTLAWGDVYARIAA